MGRCRRSGCTRLGRERVEARRPPHQGRHRRNESGEHDDPGAEGAWRQCSHRVRRRTWRRAAAWSISDLSAGRLTHADQEPVNEARDGARKRAIGTAGGWGIDRRDPSVNIAPLVAVILARLAASMTKKPTGLSAGHSAPEGGSAVTSTFEPGHHACLPPCLTTSPDILNHLLREARMTVNRRNLLRASYYDGKRALPSGRFGHPAAVLPAGDRAGLVGEGGRHRWPAAATLTASCGLTATSTRSGSVRCGTATISARRSRPARLVADPRHVVPRQHPAATSRSVNRRPDPRQGRAESATGAVERRAPAASTSFLSITARDEDEGRPTVRVLAVPGRPDDLVREGRRPKWSVDRSEHAWGVPAEPLVYKPRVGRPFGSSADLAAVTMSLHDQALADADPHGGPRRRLLVPRDVAAGRRRVHFQER